MAPTSCLNESSLENGHGHLKYYSAYEGFDHPKLASNQLGFTRHLRVRAAGSLQQWQSPDNSSWQKAVTVSLHIWTICIQCCSWQILRTKWSSKSKLISCSQGHPLPLGKGVAVGRTPRHMQMQSSCTVLEERQAAGYWAVAATTKWEQVSTERW